MSKMLNHILKLYKEAQVAKKRTLTKKAWTDLEKKQVGALDDNATGKYNIYQTNGGEIVLTNHKLGGKMYALMDTANTFEELIEKQEKNWEDSYVVWDKALLPEYEKYNGIDINDWLENDSEEEYENYHFFDLTKDYVEDSKVATTKKAEDKKEKIVDEYKVEYIDDSKKYELGPVVRISVIENGFVCGTYYVDTIMEDKDGITMYSGDTRKDDLVLTAEQRKEIQDWIKSFSKQSSNEKVEKLREKLNNDSRINSYIFSDDYKKINIKINDSKWGYKKTGFIPLEKAFDIDTLMKKENADGEEMDAEKKVVRSSKTNNLTKKAEIEYMSDLYELLLGGDIEGYKKELNNLSKKDILNYVIWFKQAGNPNEDLKEIPVEIIEEADTLLKENPNTMGVYSSKTKVVRKQADEKDVDLAAKNYEKNLRESLNKQNKRIKEDIKRRIEDLEKANTWDNVGGKEKQLGIIKRVENELSQTNDIKESLIQDMVESYKSKYPYYSSTSTVDAGKVAFYLGVYSPEVLKARKEMIERLSMNESKQSSKTNKLQKKAGEWKLLKLIAEEMEEYNKLNGSVPITDYAVYWNIEVYNDMKYLDISKLSKKAQDAILAEIETALKGGYSKGEIQVQEEFIDESDKKILNEDLLLEFFLNFEEKDLNLDDVEIDLDNEDIPESFVKFRQLAKKNNKLHKKAVLQVSENGMGYVLPNGTVVYPENVGLLKSELEGNKKTLIEQRKKLQDLEEHIKNNPRVNFGKFPGDVFEQKNILKQNIEYIEQYNETIEEILNAFKENKLPRQATKKQADDKKTYSIVEKYHDNFSGYTEDWKLKTIEKNLRQYDIADIKSELNEAKAFVRKMDNLKKMPNKEVENYYFMKDKMFIAEKLIEEKRKVEKTATIKHENGVYNVYSESGKCLGKGYKTKEEAEKRLKQVEYFKHKDKISLKQIVISKMATDLKDITESVKKNVLSDLVYVILTGKGSFAYKTVANKLKDLLTELGYADKLKANKDGSLPTVEIVELISKEPKVMELAGKFANKMKQY